MIVIAKIEMFINDIYGIDDLTEDQLNAIRIEESEKRVSFIVPSWIYDYCSSKNNESRENSLLESYKIGFLKYFLHKLYPDKGLNEIVDILRKRYHIFAARRKMLSRNTLFNQNIKNFWK